MKKTKIKKLHHVKSLLDNLTRADILNHENPKGRSLQMWLMVLNQKLPKSMKFNNNRELSGFFKFYKFSRTIGEINFQNCYRRIVFYKYLGGFKNEKKYKI